MKRTLKLILVVLPALLIAATVALTACGGDDTTNTADMAVQHDLSAPTHD
jgi:hypothetical protein